MTQTVLARHPLFAQITLGYQVVKKFSTLLDQYLDALFEKRGSTREKPLASLIEAFNNNLLNEFVKNEQQRLVFARLLLSKPALALLDAGTSALDETNEANSYGHIEAAGPK
ncbi:OLC1v1024873C2 [Oldenlandia corymbosa var. corymbosa]|uniref:OLC1v1024873C2 n=1 Tax=Oldenlandia corymbosa var. corymbosa TaxID=529605 RepID=A0AAV1C6F5_OLDCO|nr:OLC1v1024873C2 [Oldenlandia corymbosa var. corymbosa]